MLLVTGADGFVGRHLVARLVGEGTPSRALVRNLARARGVLPPAGVELVEGDTTNPGTLPPALAGVDTVIHCAFITANRKQRPDVNYYQTNVLGTRHLVAAAKDASVARIVVMGGLGTRPDKPGSYMQGRYEADQAVKRSGLAHSILGASVQFGKGSAFINGLADLIRSPAPFVPMIGSGKVRFQPIWVEDVVTCLLKMARETERYDGRTIEVGGPEILTYAQILDLLMATLGKRKRKLPGPRPLAALGAAAMQLVLRKPPITVAALGLFDFDNVATTDVVPREFGFTPTSLRDHLARYGVE
jgi:NADH dehydrogenase